MNYVTIVIDVQTIFILLCTIVYESATKLRPIKNEGTRWTYMYHVIIIFIIFQQLWYKHTCTCTLYMKPMMHERFYTLFI